MASAADKVIVTQDGMVGSVGVVATIRDYKAADEKRGIRNIEIVSTQSPKKRPDPTTPEGRDQIQEMVDGMADVFIQSVADNFGITKKFVQGNFGGGAMVLAEKALEAGMVDKIQTADELVKTIVKSNSVYSIKTISADSADSTPNMEDQTMNVKKLKTEHADVHAEIVKTVQAEEVERLREIEAIKKKFSASPEFVRDAAVNAVDAHKFDEGATVESVQDHVLNAISEARIQEVKNNVQAIHDHAAPRREAAKIAETVSEAAPTEPQNHDPEAADEAQITRMLAASKAEGRIK